MQEILEQVTGQKVTVAPPKADEAPQVDFEEFDQLKKQLSLLKQEISEVKRIV